MYTVQKRIHLLLAMGGVFIDRRFRYRTSMLLLLAASVGLFRIIEASLTPVSAALYCAVALALRYTFLFRSFGEGGWGRTLRRKYGEVRGFELYRLITGILLFNCAIGFLALLVHTSFLPLVLHPEIVAQGVIAGYVLLLGGLWVRIEAVNIIGPDIYYFKDLFLERALWEPVNEGPYKFFKHPLYGAGQACYYGAALIVGSAPGVLAVLANQVLLYLFYLTVERNHLLQEAGSRSTAPRSHQKSYVIPFRSSLFDSLGQ